MTVDLGFVEKTESWRLESRFFPSKVGGKPAWLDLKNIPTAKDLQCEYCGEPCIFLCQIYAPYEDNETAFHRTVYVFVCKKYGCCRSNQNGNVKVFRSQLPRNNPFYPSEPPLEESNWRTDINVERWTKTCFVCGILAPSHCSKCKTTNYCCRAHQVYDWKMGHEQSCGTKIKANREILFPEYEVIMETEDSDGTNSDQDSLEEEGRKEEQEIRKYEEMSKAGQVGSFQDEDVLKELQNMANYMEDETFTEFRSTIDKYPDQIVRYHRGGQVLYIASENKADKIPKCAECSGDRQFEFQIMPQLLNFLALDNTLACIDWGILAIYTCVKSCTLKQGYCKEFLWKQDIVQGNLD